MKNFSLGLLLILFLCSCPGKSVLSEVDLTDPSIICPEIKLTRIRYEDMKLNNKIDVRLCDSKGDYVQLKNGSVSVNGHELGLRENILRVSYYTIYHKTLPVEANKEYEFTIVLADGKKYKAAIKTQETDLYQLNVPKKHKKGNDMEISWKGRITEAPLAIYLTCFTGSAGRPGNNYKLEPNKEEQKACKYLISKELFNNDIDTVTSVRIKLSSEKYGTIDSAFMPGAKIYSCFEVEKNCKLK